MTPHHPRTVLWPDVPHRTHRYCTKRAPCRTATVATRRTVRTACLRDRRDGAGRLTRLENIE